MRRELLTPTKQRNREAEIPAFIQYLKGINENRIIAFNCYPNSVSARKWGAVYTIRQKLKEIQLCDDNPKGQIKQVLRLENPFLTIQPYTTKEINEIYVRKINMCMDACREYLGLQKQRA